MASSLQQVCKPFYTGAAKSLKSGSGGGTRTPDTRIMMPRVSLESRGFSVNLRPDAPQLSVTFRAAVNHTGGSHG